MFCGWEANRIVWRHIGHASQTHWYTHLRAQWPQKRRGAHHWSTASLSYSDVALTNDPKVIKITLEMTLGYPRSGVVLGLKGPG